MLGFVQNFMGPKANPIGITFGAETLRVAQIMEQRGEMRIIAAASRDVPATVRENPAQRLEFFAEAIRGILADGGFRGRHVVLGLPAANLAMVHLRLPQMEESAIRKAILFEATGKLPFHPSQALIRHIVAGEVYDKQEQKLETILMASPRASVEGYLAAAARSKLDVVAMCAEPLAVVECFTRLGRRKEDTESVTCYLDIGAGGSRVLIALGRRVLFARSIAIGGDDFTRALAKETGTKFQDAKLKRIQVSAGEPVPEGEELSEPAPTAAVENSFAFLGAGSASAAGVASSASAAVSTGTAVMETPNKTASDIEIEKIFTAIRQPLDRLISEIEMCRRYHDATFPALMVQRMVFAGGEARQRSLCSTIARRLGLPASVWDPVARLPADVDHAAELTHDSKPHFPEWAVAIGLSMGIAE